MEELDGSDHVKLAGHEELDGQLLGQRRHSMLTGPLGDLLQELPGGLQHTHTHTASDSRTRTSIPADCGGHRRTAAAVEETTTAC